MDKEKVELLLSNIYVDAEIANQLSGTLKANTAFSRTLDGQIDVIAQRTAQIKQNSHDLSLIVSSYLKQDEANKAAKVPVPKVEAPEEYKAPISAVVAAAGISDPSKPVEETKIPEGASEVKSSELSSEASALLEQFKDKP